MATKKKAAPSKKKPAKPRKPKSSAVAKTAATDLGIAVLDTKRVAMMHRIHQILNEGSGQSTSHARTRFGTLAEQRRDRIPWPSLAMQYMTGSYGIEFPGVMELIGDAGTGKSTLAMHIAGSAMLHLKAECLLIDCENKHISEDRARRALSDNPIASRLLHERVSFAKAFSLTQMEDALQDWVTSVRKAGLPLHIPLVVIVDPWSALMSEKEAAVQFQYKNVKKKTDKINVTGEGSNLAHAKWAHAKGRKLPQFISANNVFLLLVNHQTVHIDMSGGKSMPTPEWVKQINNATALGGRAWKQRALLTLVLASSGYVVDDQKNTIGLNVKFKVHKYSYGPSWRMIETVFRTRHETRDKAEYLDPAWVFSPFCKQLAEDSVAGISISNKLFTIDFNEQIRYRGLTEEQLYLIIQTTTELRDAIARHYGIAGYNEISAQITNTRTAEAKMVAEEIQVEEAEDEGDDETDEDAEETAPAKPTKRSRAKPRAKKK